MLLHRSKKENSNFWSEPERTLVKPIDTVSLYIYIYGFELMCGEEYFSSARQIELE